MNLRNEEVKNVLCKPIKVALRFYNKYGHYFNNKNKSHSDAI